MDDELTFYPGRVPDHRTIESHNRGLVFVDTISYCLAHIKAQHCMGRVYAVHQRSPALQEFYLEA